MPPAEPARKRRVAARPIDTNESAEADPESSQSPLRRKSARIANATRRPKAQPSAQQPLSETAGATAPPRRKNATNAGPHGTGNGAIQRMLEKEYSHRRVQTEVIYQDAAIQTGDEHIAVFRPLPREIIDMIVSSSVLDKNDIKNISLLNKAWGAAARAVLFERICFHEKSMQMYRGFTELMRDDCYIREPARGDVKDLKLVFGAFSFEPPALAHTVAKLPNLRTLHLVYIRQLPSTLMDVFLHDWQLPRLEKLTLERTGSYGTTEFLRTLYYFPSEELYLTKIALFDMEPGEQGIGLLAHETWPDGLVVVKSRKLQVWVDGKEDLGHFKNLTEALQMTTIGDSLEDLELVNIPKNGIETAKILLASIGSKVGRLWLDLSDCQETPGKPYVT